MKKSFLKRIGIVVAGAMLVTMASVIAPPAKTSAAAMDPYEQRFMDMYNKIHDPANGYFSPLGIPYHSVETLMCEAPDYGHETSSETFSYYLWLEAMDDSFTGNWSSFNNAWNLMEKYMIPSSSDQLESSMSRYNAGKPATYAPEYDLPSLYPAKLDTSAPVGQDPINSDLVSTYGTDTMYGMHWLLDTDNWYGFGTRGDGKTAPSFINTFQRGPQESVWETIPQPCWDAFNFGGKNGYLDLFTGDSSYAKQFKYTDAPDADARVVQATYDAALWSGDNGASIAPDIKRASKLGDYLRYAMFDKYFRKIGSPTVAGTGYDSAHYLLSWYYAWGGATDGTWSWKIGCSHNHFGYQNPLTAWILSTDASFKPLSKNGASDWSKSLQREIEFYEWLQSSEGAIAGGCSNSNGGQYLAWPSGTSTFYGMGYEANPVYEDPGSNTWFGMQTWSMQRMAEYYYTTKDPQVKALLDKWVAWAESEVQLNADGTFAIPSTIDWSGQPDTWTGTPTGNPDLHVTVVNYGTDLGVTASLANTLLYYSAATGDDTSQQIAKELLDRTAALYTDDKGVSVPETRADYSRFADTVYVPAGWTGTMPNGDQIHSGSTFISIRSKYQSDPDWPKVQAYLDGGPAPTFNYHRFWAETEVALANGLYYKLFGAPQQNSTISPTSAVFDKSPDEQADVPVTLNLNGNTFTGIDNGLTSLTEGTDYTVDGDTVTVSKDYLAAQPVGTTTLSFLFSAGAQADLTVDVIDSSSPPPPPPPTGNIKVQMFNSGTAGSSSGITPHFRVVNTGDAPIDLSQIKVRYYYTENGTQGQTFWCDWSSAGTGNVTGTFGKLAAPVDGADSYLEIGFTSAAGSLAPGAYVEVQARFSKSDWSNYTQTDDYSFDATDTNYVDWLEATGYVGGVLEWGVEPTGSVPGQDSSISPTTAYFDKNPENQANVTVAMTLNGNTFSAIQNGSTPLDETTDYVVAEDNTVTILSSYLADLPVGATTLTFTFSGGSAKTLTVNVTDTSVTPPPPPTTGNLSVQMYNGSTQSQTNGIAPRFKLTNTGTAAINLSSVKLHYYFTSDGSQSETYWCDWSTAGSANVTYTFQPVSPSKNGADTCLELGFTAAAGSLAPGASVEVQGRFSKSDWSNYNQGNDYSFDATDTTYADWPEATAYEDGALVWGSEPV